MSDEHNGIRLCRDDELHILYAPGRWSCLIATQQCAAEVEAVQAIHPIERWTACWAGVVPSIVGVTIDNPKWHTTDGSCFVLKLVNLVVYRLGDM